MTKEYIKIRQLQIDKLKRNNQENAVDTTEIQYKPGLIAEFRGVHPDTNRHILKVYLKRKLFFFFFYFI